MILTLINLVGGTRTYLSGVVTVPESGSTTIPRGLNVLISQDAQFIYDIIAGRITITDGINEYTGPSAIELVKIYSHYATDPLATGYLYYTAPVNIRHSAGLASGNTVWAMRNPAASPLYVFIERIFLNMAFSDPTPLTGINEQRYELARFSAATPTGGSAITPIRTTTIASASACDVRQSSSGLTMSGAILESGFGVIGCPEVVGAVSNYTREKHPFTLAPGEGLAINVATIDAVDGQSLQGEIVWSLR